MNFLSNLGQSIVGGFKSAIAPLLPQGFFTERPENTPTTASLLSNAQFLSAPQKIDTGLTVRGLEQGFQPDNVFAKPGGEIIGQVSPSGLNVLTNPDAFSQSVKDFNQSIRPLITTQPTLIQSPRLPEPSTVDRFGKPLPPSPQAPSGRPGIAQPIGGGFQQQQAQQETTGLGGFAGTGAGASLGGAVGGIGTPNILSSEEQSKKTTKQPQFTMITAQQAQDAARQGLLQGAGQSGVFKDAQGNFYGISNAQVANVFTPQAGGKLDVTQQSPTTPFQTSLATGPISAEALLKGGETGKVIPTGDVTQTNLQSYIDQSLQNQPPLPQQPVIETPEQQMFLKSSQDPYGLQAAMDASRTKVGLPDLENQRIQVMKNAQALQEGIQKIVKDLNDNPDFPKGLAARMISDFTNKNAITLQNLQGQLQIINTQIDQANEAVNREFGIAKYNIETQRGQQEQARDNARQQIQQYISSGAFAEFSDEQLRQVADAKVGYDIGGLKTMRDALKKNQNKYDSIITKENAAGDVSIIGLDKAGNAEVIKTIKGIGTPSAAETTETTPQATISFYSNTMSKAIDAGASTADQIVAGVQAVALNSGVNLNIKDLNALKTEAERLLKNKPAPTAPTVPTPIAPQTSGEGFFSSIYNFIFGK